MDFTVLRKENSTLKHCSTQLSATCLAFWAHLFGVFFIPVNKWPNVELTSHADICSRKVEFDGRKRGEVTTRKVYLSLTISH